MPVSAAYCWVCVAMGALTLAPPVRIAVLGRRLALDHARPGLSIVEQVALAHGAQMTFEWKRTVENTAAKERQP